jgi:hypothetical protein
MRLHSARTTTSDADRSAGAAVATVPEHTIGGDHLTRILDAICSQRGKPNQNAYVASFNGRFHDECLNEQSVSGRSALRANGLCAAHMRPFPLFFACFFEVSVEVVASHRSDQLSLAGCDDIAVKTTNLPLISGPLVVTEETVTQHRVRSIIRAGAFNDDELKVRFIVLREFTGFFG